MKALRINSYGITRDHVEVATVPKPEAPAGHLLVNVKAVALNPVDAYIALGYFKSPLPSLFGSDFAGVVESVGAGVTKFKSGDEVSGFTGLVSKYGTLAEFAIVPQEQVFRKPKTMSFEEASTLGVGALTAILGLFLGNDLPLPSKGTVASNPGQPWFALIWGASGSVGSYAVQLAKLGGYEVIAVCSPANFDAVRALGASHVVDRAAADLVDQVKKISGGKLRVVIDAVASAETAEKAAAVLSTEVDAYYSHVLPLQAKLPAHIKTYEIQLGKLGPSLAPYLNEAADEVTNLIAAGKLKPNAVDKLPGGLGGAYPGFEALVKHTVSGKKLVVTIGETA